MEVPFKTNLKILESERGEVTVRNGVRWGRDMDFEFCQAQLYQISQVHVSIWMLHNIPGLLLMFVE